MKKVIALSLGFVASICSLHAQSFEAINPRVHHITPLGSKAQTLPTPTSVRLSYESSRRDTYPIQALQQLWPQTNTRATYQVIAGIRSDKNIKSVAREIPSKPEGYLLRIEGQRIIIAGHDERGLYYGIQSLRDLMEQGQQLPIGQVTDYPDVPYRGVVEGFYGTPWSHAARLRQLDYYGRHKLNVYIYGPKDDPYHSVPNWRKPYPEAEARQIQELTERARQRGVLFYWAIHPGQDIKWTEEDRDLVIQKFEWMYALGVRAFAVFFDDITGEGTKAEKQAELLNYIDNHFIKRKTDVAPLVMCPTEYNKSWSNIKGGYLPTLGERLNPGIEIMWTGNTVVACIDKPDMAWINGHLKRKAYIWFNFPVSDYVRDHMLLGPTYGNSLEIKDDLAGFLSNPMEHAEASKIALYSIADYTWHMASYDSQSSWQKAMREVLPQAAEALECFASHSSDLGPNGHRFRRDESVALTPHLEQLWQSRGRDAKASAAVEQELVRLERACDVLLGHKSNPYLINEIRPWLRQGRLLAKYGQQALRLVREGQAGQWAAFGQTHQHARALEQQMYDLDLQENQNPYQPGVQVGSKILRPTIDSLMTYWTETYNASHQPKLSTASDILPLRVETSIEQLRHQPLRHRGNQLTLTPPLEVIRFTPGASFSLIARQLPLKIQEFVFDLDAKQIASDFVLEVQTDSGWQSVELQQHPDRKPISAHGAISAQPLTALRLTYRGTEPREVRMRSLRLKLQIQ